MHMDAHPGDGDAADVGRDAGEALVLSGSIGRGHDSVAEACRVALSSADLPVRVVDCMALLGGAGARIGGAAFRRLLSVPAIYDGFHFSHLRNGTRLPHALERAANRRLVPAVQREAGRLAGRRLIVSVFPTGVSAAGRLKAADPTITTVVVCTDACAHRMWVSEGIDLYVVCSPLAAATVRRYDPHASVAVIPPPVRPGFYSAPAKHVARRALGVPADVACVLVMGGGWGLAPLAETAEALASAGYWVLAVAGANERLHHRLLQVSDRLPTVRPFGLTERVPELMAAADAVVTSPGQQTCTEARVVGRWLVVLDVVPGHGRENVLHEVEMGGALVCSPRAGSVVGAVDALFHERPEHVLWPVRDAADWEKQFLGALSTVGVTPPERQDRRDGVTLD